MKKQISTPKNFDAFRASSLDTAQQNATTGGFLNFTFGFMGIPTKIMMGSMVLYDCCGNGNGVW